MNETPLKSTTWKLTPRRSPDAEKDPFDARSCKFKATVPGKTDRAISRVSLVRRIFLLGTPSGNLRSYLSRAAESPYRGFPLAASPGFFMPEEKRDDRKQRLRATLGWHIHPDTEAGKGIFRAPCISVVRARPTINQRAPWAPGFNLCIDTDPSSSRGGDTPTKLRRIPWISYRIVPSSLRGFPSPEGKSIPERNTDASLGNAHVHTYTRARRETRQDFSPQGWGEGGGNGGGVIM